MFRLLKKKYIHKYYFYTQHRCVFACLKMAISKDFFSALISVTDKTQLSTYDVANIHNNHAPSFYCRIRESLKYK